jgi:DNA polymerase III delta prime subunit
MPHALLYIGTLEQVRKLLPEEERTPDADTRHISREQFGIEDARELAREAALLPLLRPARTFVVAFSRATREAQNALLKTLEEPAPTTRFRIIVPREDILIATVRSRLMPVSAADTPKESAAAAEFLAKTYAERLQEIGERTKKKNDAWVGGLLDGLEVWAADRADAAALSDLALVRRYADTRGASKKMLLEHLALTLPA